MKKCFSVVVLAGVCFSASPAYSQSSWVGGTGNWSTPAQWNPSGVPTGVSVTIDSGAFDQVNLDQNAGITSLLIGGFSRLDFYNGNALTVSGDANAAGGFLMHAGSATIVGTLTNSGTLHVSQEGFGASTLMAGSLVNTGVVQIGKLGTVTLTNPLTDVAPGSYLIVDGNLKSGSGSALARLTTVEGNLSSSRMDK